MKKITINAPAKVNLTLDVLDKRIDGYHNVKMVMQSISLCDKIKITKTNNPKINISCNIGSVPTDESNIVYKCAKIFLDRYSIIGKGVDIFIEKNIPMGAGLGGGSADGAGVLVGMNKLFKNVATLDELCNIGSNVGADIPFCIVGGTCICQGIGEILTPVRCNTNIHYVLVKPDISISTKKVYDIIDQTIGGKRPNTSEMVRAINDGDINAIGLNLCNVMEQAASTFENNIGYIKNRLLTFGAIGSLMSGSGSCVYGIFNDKDSALRCLNKMKVEFDNCYYAINNDGMEEINKILFLE